MEARLSTHSNEPAPNRFVHKGGYEYSRILGYSIGESLHGCDIEFSVQTQEKTVNKLSLGSNIRCDWFDNRDRERQGAALIYVHTPIQMALYLVSCLHRTEISVSVSFSLTRAVEYEAIQDLWTDLVHPRGCWYRICRSSEPP
jgi:hypothetical protein